MHTKRMATATTDYSNKRKQEDVDNGYTEEVSDVLENTSEKDIVTEYGAIESATVTDRSTSSGSYYIGTTSSLTGRPPILLYLTCDDDVMSPYQCLVRKQIELFEADLDDIESNAQGRNKAITLGQVGIRCRYCKGLPPNQRNRGSTYYPSKLDGVYQAASNLAIVHLGEHCQIIDDQLRNELASLRNMLSSGGAGKKIWADRAEVLGVFEDSNGLRFLPTIDYRHRHVN